MFNSDLILVRIFPYLDLVPSPDSGKYMPEKTPNSEIFQAVPVNFVESKLRTSCIKTSHPS